MHSSLKKLAYGLLYDIKGRKSKIDEIYDVQNIDSRFADELKHILIKHDVQCCSIAFLDKEGKASYISAGYNYNGDKVDRKTLFRLASISKMFLTIIVLRMYERGLIDIYRDISEYLGEKFYNPKFPNEKINLYQLLTHTSGLIDGDRYYSSFESNSPYYEILEFSEYKPGENFSYSNFGYGVVGIALEKFTGKSIDTLLQEEICIPIGINACYLPNQGDDVAAIIRVLNKSAKPNYLLDDELYYKNEIYKTLPVECRYLKAAGGVHCGSEALLQLASVMLEDNNASNRLLSKSSIELMQTISSRYRDSIISMYYGMGMQIIDDKKVCHNALFGHEGFAYGAVNMCFFDPKKNRAIIQLNGGAREWCNGKLACLNQDIIKWYYKNY